jgi:hypothetical protein
MEEITVNLHMHTLYSDGFGTHADIARAAIQAGVDVVYVTDHNVLVNGPEEVYREGRKRVLLLVGEEVHNQARQPQKSHLLVLGADREMATYAHDPQLLINSARQAGGLTFIAHPLDPAAPAVGEDDLSWDDWQTTGFTGIELWNHLSEFKTRLKTKFHALYYGLFPAQSIQGPFPEVLQKWDELLASGVRVVAVGGSDAHALPARMGPFRRTVFPYEYHFRAINNHMLIQSPLTGNVKEDRRLVLEALGRGRGFIGYDLPAPTKGFRFTAQGRERTAWMGEEISCQSGVTLQVRLPLPAECRLVKDGKLIKQWVKRETIVHITTEPGAYRVEVHLEQRGRRTAWIYSNPIYVVR